MLLSFPRERPRFVPPYSTKGTSLNDQILNAMDEEIAKLRQVRAVLTESGQATPSRKSATTSTPAAANTKPRRTLSAKARRAIAEAQRRRWAKVRTQKQAAAPAAPAKKESAAN